MGSNRIVGWMHRAAVVLLGLEALHVSLWGVLVAIVRLDLAGETFSPFGLRYFMESLSALDLTLGYAAVAAIWPAFFALWKRSALAIWALLAFTFIQASIWLRTLENPFYDGDTGTYLLFVNAALLVAALNLRVVRYLR